MEYYPDQPADNNNDQLKGFRLYSSLEDKEKSSDMPPADLTPVDAPTDADSQLEAKYFNSANNDLESSFIDEIFPNASETDIAIPGISETREESPDEATIIAPETSEEFLDPLYSDTGFEPDLPPAIDALPYEETHTNDHSIDKEPAYMNSPDSNSNAFTPTETGPEETIQSDNIQMENIQMEDVQREDVQREDIPNEEIPNEEIRESEENNQIDTPQDRLKHWIKSSFKNDSQFCREIGMNRSSLYNYLPGGDRIIPKRYNEKLVELGLDLKWYLEGEKALDGKKKHVKKTRKDNGEFGSPQARLRQWIKDNFKSSAALAHKLGVHPNLVYNHTSPTGPVYGTKYLQILAKMGLDVNWYLKGKKRKYSDDKKIPTGEKVMPEAGEATVVTPIPGHKESITAPNVATEPEFYAEAPLAGTPSFTKMLEQYTAQEAKLLEEKRKIDMELEKIQAIMPHLIELDKLFKA